MSDRTVVVSDDKRTRTYGGHYTDITVAVSEHSSKTVTTIVIVEYNEPTYLQG